MRAVKRALDLKETCPICGEVFDSKQGHNPAPLEVEGKVCGQCNIDYVIPARLEELGLADENKAHDEEIYRHPQYAVKYNVGDKVRFIHPGSEYSDEAAEIIGFDEEGLYQIKWLDDGSLSHGLADINLVSEDAVEGNEDPYYDDQRHAFDNKAQDSKPEKLKITIRRVKK